MKLNKKFIFILSVAYLFCSMGINSYAIGNCLCNMTPHKVQKISCSCCCGHKHCSCIKNKNIPFNNNIQSTLNLINYTSYFENICTQVNPIHNFSIFENISGYKIHKKCTLVSNKNLEMLRSVILLN